MIDRDPGFAHEQLVQEAIALIQKVTRLSILKINEQEIRRLIEKGRTPCQIARAWARTYNPLVRH